MGRMRTHRIDFKKAVAIGLVLFVSGIFYTQGVQAAPSVMNFQGRLRTSTGSVVADGLYNVKFAIYSASSGGTLVWSETRETTSRIQVTDGLFSTQLGQVTPLPASVFTSDALYFETTMATPATATCATAACASWETPMTPRHQLASSAYAMNADMLDGQHASDFAAASGSNSYIQNTQTPQNANFNIIGAGTIGGAAVIGGNVSQIQMTVKANSAQTITTPHIVLQDSTTSEGARLGAFGSNLVFGRESLSVNTGAYNVAVGQYVLKANTSGNYNTGVGAAALAANTIGNDNTALGEASLWNNTTGNRNMAIGTDSMVSNTTGSDNVAIGFNALSANNADGNVGIGLYALRGNTSGAGNTAIGVRAGDQDYGGAFKTVTILQNATAIGAFAQVQDSHSVVLGSIDLPTKVGIGTTKPDAKFSVSPVAYRDGTASQSGTAVTGIGTTWNATLVGKKLIFADGTSTTITAFTDATHLTVSTSATVASQAYRIHYAGFNVTDTGAVTIGRISPSGTNALTIQGSGEVSGTIQAQSFEARGYLTTSTASDGTGPWTRLGYCELDVQYYDCRSKLDIAAIGDSGSMDRATLDVRIKQQNALGSAPTVSLRVSDTINIDASQFKTVTVTNSASLTRVEVWGRVMYPWQIWVMTSQSNGGSYLLKWQSEQGLAATLPAGTQNNAEFTNFTTNGLAVKPMNNTTTALLVQNAAGTGLFSVNAINNRIVIGSGTASANPVVLVLDNKNTTGDPTGVEGATYYNAADKMFRCYRNGTWENCAGGYTIGIQALTSSPVSGQTVYFGAYPRMPMTTPVYSRILINKAGVVRAAIVSSYSDTAGSGEAWSMYIRKNNSTDTLLSTVSAAANERLFFSQNLSIPVAVGDSLEIKSVQPTWATSPVSTAYGGYFYIE